MQNRFFVLVFLLVLDLLGSCGEEESDSPIMVLFNPSEGEDISVLEHEQEQEHEHEFPTSGFASIAGRIPIIFVVIFVNATPE